MIYAAILQMLNQSGGIKRRVRLAARDNTVNTPPAVVTNSMI
jgi:hypothetical protein